MSPEHIAENASSSEPGYFGKIPTHGDFVTRGLPRSFVAPWDTWLQEAITASRRQLGENWLNFYLTSPIYRFALSPGIGGEFAWLGILMPCVDRVGRYYPMTISAAANPATNPLTALQDYDRWFTQVEILALTCLQDDFSLEAFNQSLSALTLDIPPDERQTDASEPRHDDNLDYAWQRSVEQVDEISRLLPDILDDLIKEFCLAYSAWWTQGSEQIAASLLVCEGLPPFEGMAALFDGNWQKWGWDGRRFPILSSEATP